MKKYKNLVPLVLVVLFVAAAYMMVSNAKSTEAEYVGYIQKARASAEKGIVSDSVTFYEGALRLRDSVDLRLEIGNMLVENQLSRDAVEWGGAMIKKYPESPQAYLYLLERYRSMEDYTSCYQIYDIWVGHKVESAEIEAFMKEIAYIYTMDYKLYGDVSVFSEGLCAVQSKELWGYVNTKGKVVIKPRFLQADAFGSERAVVKDQEGDIYYINTEGDKKLVMPEGVSAEGAGLLINGVATIYDGKEYNFWDLKETESSFVKRMGPYNYASTLNYGVAAVKTGESWSLIDAQGVAITDKNYKGFALDEKGIAFRNKRAFALVDNGYVMLDENGAAVADAVYDDVFLFLGDGWAAVKKGNKWGFAGSDGQMKIEPQYENARSFSSGLAAVELNGRWGFINEQGELAIDAQFEEVKDFNSQGSVFVKNDGSWVLLKLYSKNH